MTIKEGIQGIKANILSWTVRVVIYAVAVGLGACTVCWGTAWLVDYLEGLTAGSTAGSTATKNTPLFNPTIPVALFLFAFIVSIGTWIIRTYDTLQQFQDSLQVRNDTLFIEATRLLLEGDNVQSRATGLVQMIGLRDSNAIEAQQVDPITASGIQLFEGGKSANLQRAKLQDAKLQGAKLQCAKLQGANLQGANLQGANLEGANLLSAGLQGANLQGTELQDANLEGARYDDKTLFPDGFDEAQKQQAGMIKVKLTGTLKAELNDY